MVAIAQYGDKDKLLVQTFPRNLTKAALAWFTKIEIIKISRTTNLFHLFIEQHKLNSEIAPYREQL